MLSGDVPDACKTCHRVEQAGGVSKRFREAEHSVPKDYDNLTAEDGSINIPIFAGGTNSLAFYNNGELVRTQTISDNDNTNQKV